MQQRTPPLRLQRLLALHQKRFNYRRQIKICRDAICPISWIPNEVLREIFVHCIPPNHRFSRTIGPLLLLQVCQLWRNTAVLTHTLWTRVAFWTPASSTDLICYPLRFVQRWMAHSGRHSLDIYLEQGLVRHHMRFVVEMVLLAHYSQCRHLDIHATHDSGPALANFITLPPGSLTSLESLVLEGLDEAYFANAITVFQNSPRLRKMTTNALDFAFSVDMSTSSIEFDALVLPWARLTHLMITEFIMADTFVVVLAECTALQFLRVSLDLGVNDATLPLNDWLPDQPVALSSLTDLHISVSDGSCIPPVMNSLKFPALQSLHFRRSESSLSHPFSWESSLHFILQLRGLQSLSLVGRVGAVEEIATLLQSTPQVTHLKLDIWTKYQILIPILFPPLGRLPFQVSHAKFLPALTCLSLRLEKSDLPFPSDCIRDSVGSTQCLLTDLTMIMHRRCQRQLQEIQSQFSFSFLQTTFGTQAGPIDRLLRDQKDKHLIDCERTSRHYDMVDPVTSLVNLI